MSAAKMQNTSDIVSYPTLATQYWLYPIVFTLFYYGYDLISGWKSAKKNGELPLHGPLPTLLPPFVLNLVYAAKAASLMEDGFRRFKDKAYQLLRNDGSMVVLPASLLEELSALPSTIASPHSALERDLLGDHTGLDVILETRMHHTIVQRKLTPRLSTLTSYLEKELTLAFDEYFPACDEWTEFQPYQVFAKVSARLSARALVGPELCHDATWLDISVNYTENLFRTIVILRLFPGWTHRIIRYILPSYWKGKNYIQKAKDLLGPIIQNLLDKGDNEHWTPSTSEEQANVLHWLADAAKGNDRDANTLSHVQVLLALASVHTTLLRMVNVLYDVAGSPDHFSLLNSEIEDVRYQQPSWPSSVYGKLDKLDSVLRESQRMSPPTTVGLKRLFKQPYTFSTGLHISKGSYVCLPIFAIENDPEVTPNPAKFDGLRSYRLRQEYESGDRKRDDHLFSSMEPTVLNFGYGKSACPGRQFASLIIKMVFVKLFTEYEVKFLDGEERPQNLMAHEFLFCWPWHKMLVKRKFDGACPF
ncbi:putative cytochrome P450 [Clathrospora elynae]|uniref:Putative cytochrome P450 n=1 Tax=Clathrospora elynae TaxID=706981 RepID=A0A6A5SL56_9PLEO|nr:putative cytochrome P450 [Clathrospora elynae]